MGIMDSISKWLDDRHNHRELEKHHVQYKTFPTINGRIMIAKFADGGTIKLGSNVVINSSFVANPVGGHQTVFLIKGKDGVIEIDDNAGMSNVIIGVYSHIYIGKYVNIGAGTKIFDNDFHSLDFEERMKDINIKSRPVRIEYGCFIGGDTIILKGVTIGEKSVIGAGSVVTKNVPPGEVWCGNPARFVKKL